MTDRLAVESVLLTDFGGMRAQTHLELPSSGLVVLEGPNEAGKSTLAEAIGWLLAGPTPLGEVVSRLGDRHDTLEARLTGTVDKSALTLSGRFEIMANERAKERESSCTLGGADLPVEDFRQRIGLAEPSIYHHVFRIEGADGHRPSTAEDLVLRAASGVFGPVDPQQVADDLEERAKLVGKSSRQSFDSVRKRSHEISSLKQQFEEAAQQIDEYQEQVALADRESSDAADLKEQLDELRARSAAFAHARDLCNKEVEYADLLNQLEGLDEPEEPWLRLLGQLEELKATRRDLSQNRASLERASIDGRGAAMRRSSDLERLAGLVVDEAVTTHLVKAADQAESARHQHQLSSQHAETADSLVNRASERSRAALAALGPLASQPGFDPRNARLEDPTPLLARVESVRNAQGALEQANTAARTAGDDSDTAASALTGANDRYAAFGVDAEAEGLLTNTAPPSPSGSTSSDASWIRWFAPAALLVVALIAALSQQFLVTGLAVAAAVVAALLAQRTASAARPDTTFPSEELRAAALDVRDAQKTADDKAINARRAFAEVTSAQQHLDTVQAALEMALSNAGLPTDTPFEQVGSLIANWKAAAAAVAKKRETEEDSQRAAEALKEAADKLADDQERLRTELEPYGLESDGPASVAAALGKLANDVALAKQAIEADQQLTDLTTKIARLLEPVGLRVDESDKAIELCKDLEDLREQRSTLESQTDGLSHDIANLKELSPKAAELASRYPDLADLQQAESALNSQIEERDRENQAARDRATTARSEAKRLLDTDQVSDLEHQLSENEAAANDLATEAITHALAHLLVTEEADREERSRQPVLIETTSRIATRVAREWSQVRLVRPPAGQRGGRLVVDLENGSEVPAHQLSTGARMALYLSLRAAMADNLTANSSVALPLMCDDPLAHIDGDRAPMVMQVLAEAAEHRQVILLTCHDYTVELAKQAGAAVASMPEPEGAEYSSAP